MVCAAKEQNVIGRGAVSRSTTAQWQDLEFSFTVPESDCPAQYVKLVFDARSASEKFISGNIWLDDFKIARDDTAKNVEPPDAVQQSGTGQIANRQRTLLTLRLLRQPARTPAGTQVEPSPALVPPGNRSVPPANNEAATGTSVVAPPAGEVTVRPQIYDPSLLAPNRPASQAPPPQ